MTYKVKFTPLAEAFAKAKSTLETVEAQARAEVESLDGLSDPRKLILHCFEAGGQDFMCVGTKDGIEIDTCTYEEVEDGIEEGPFKGMKLMMPTRDSD